MQGSTKDRPLDQPVHPDGSLSCATRLLQDLIAFASVSSTSNRDISQYCESVLEQLGFQVSRTQYRDSRSVEKVNLLAVRKPGDAKSASKRIEADRSGLAYFSHTDVVPAEKWVGTGSEDADAFVSQIKEDRLFGRGACDMKGSIAAMLSAVARVDPSEQTAPLWVGCTADEEVGFEGAKYLVAHCPEYRRLAAADPITIIGEPTMLRVVHAHKGIYGFKIISRGKAAHSATSRGVNANEAMVPMLVKLLEICQRTRTDASLMDARFDPPILSWNFGVSDHSNVVNITPGISEAWVSLRPMPDIDGRGLVEEARHTADALGLEFVPFDGCGPIWNDPRCDAVAQFQELAGTDSQTVCYSTDGGVLNELSRRIVIGPGSIEQAHTVDEWISLDQLDRGIDLYEKAIRHWCVKAIGDTER